MFAAIDPNAPQWVGAIALTIFSLAGGMNQVAALIARWRGEPPSEVLKASADVMSNEVLTLKEAMRNAGTKLERAVQFDHRITHLEEESREAIARRRAMYQKIEQVEHILREEIKRELGGIYSEVNKLREGQASLEANDEHQNQHLTHIEAKVDRLIERRTP
jgi:hypothetical protein